jgi:hypothetical protein
MYSSFTTDQINYIEQLKRKIVTGRVHSREFNIDTQYCTNWMAIFYPYFRDKDKAIQINSEYCYFKNADLESHYPTNPTARNLLSPFNSFPNHTIDEISFIGTTTGTKIYDYANALVEKAGYTNFKSVAMVLTQDRNHKVKVIKLDNRVFVITNRISNELVIKTLTLYPILFDIAELKDDELVKECCKKVSNKENIIECFTHIFKLKEEEASKALETLLIKMAKKNKGKRITELEDLEKRILRNIQDYENSLMKYYDELDKTQSDLLGAKETYAKLTFDFSDVNEYLKRNTYIKSIVACPGYGSEEDLLIEFVAPITIYDPEALKRQLENLKYYLSNSSHKFLDVLKRIFVDGEYTMYCNTKVRLRLSQNDVEASKDTLHLYYTDYSHMIQPHLVIFNCWGDQKSVIRKSLKDGDFISALQLMTNQVQNINFTDSTVIKNWVTKICDNHALRTIPTCLSRVDGQMWTIEQIIDQLLEEQRAAEAEAKANIEQAQQIVQEIVETTEEIGHPEITDEIPLNF